MPTPPSNDSRKGTAVTAESLTVIPIKTAEPETSTTDIRTAKEDTALKRSNTARKALAKPGRFAHIRVKLPTIESFEKELEFQADAPGRVVVRLERLMGTDRIRITDPKYMAQLLKKLEEEEQHLWVKRSMERKKLERERFRQLAIDGLMEPGKDMMYLHKHPVFRVNRILKRLSKLDSTMSTTAAKKLPPITEVEPFEELEKTGILFGFHKNHYMKSEESFRSNMKNYTPVASARSSMEKFRPPRFNENGVLIVDAPESSEEEEEWGGEDYYRYLNMVEETKERLNYEELLQTDSLTQAKLHYGIRAEEDLETTWSQQRSNLIDQLYSEEMDDAEAMLDFSKEVLGTYKREQLVADNFCQKVHRKHFL